MNQSTAEVVAEFPERGVQWVKEQFEAVVSDTGDYVRQKPAQSLVWAFVAGFLLNRLPVGRIVGGLIRLLMFALKPAILVYGAAKLYQRTQEQE
ncbi:MAG TPA: hypothetical protein VH229_08425 [Candidatus Udaeobacter sp.]|jgi:hypothetical protein|nr:hypothetical protein [Candidatus Udaeobacter sp.]